MAEQTPTTADGYVKWLQNRKKKTDAEVGTSFTDATAEQIREDIDIFKTQMKAYGFDDNQINQLVSRVRELRAQRISMVNIATSYLPQEQIYKERFSANEVRVKRGLQALTPAEYLQEERAYARILREYGMPRGFYDDPKTDFAAWIAGDVSPTEVEDRVKVAEEWKNNLDPQSKEALKRFYGIGDESLVAYALDPKRALPIIQRQAEAVKLGAEAMRQNIRVDRGYAEQLTDIGITQREAREGFGATAQLTPDLQQLAAIEGTGISQREVAESQFGTSAEATRRVRGLASRERARFGGTSGGDQILGSGMSGSY